MPFGYTALLYNSLWKPLLGLSPFLSARSLLTSVVAVQPHADTVTAQRHDIGRGGVGQVGQNEADGKHPTQSAIGEDIDGAVCGLGLFDPTHCVDSLS